MKLFEAFARKRNAVLTGTFLLYVVAPHTACSQPDSGIPAPEYFGIYASSNGHLIKVDGREIRADKNVVIRLGQRQSVGGIINGAPVAASQPVTVPVFAPDMKIVVYAETGGLMSPLQAAEPLRIVPLVFVRNVSVDTGMPNNIRRSGPENGWEFGTTPDMLGIATGDHPEALELLKKPFPQHPGIIIAGFADKLPPGVYRFILQPGSGIPIMNDSSFFTFAVEPLAEAESAKCVDVAVAYAMMIANTKYRA